MLCIVLLVGLNRFCLTHFSAARLFPSQSAICGSGSKKPWGNLPLTSSWDKIKRDMMLKMFPWLREKEISSSLCIDIGGSFDIAVWLVGQSIAHLVLSHPVHRAVEGWKSDPEVEVLKVRRKGSAVQMRCSGPTSSKVGGIFRGRGVGYLALDATAAIVQQPRSFHPRQLIN